MNTNNHLPLAYLYAGSNMMSKRFTAKQIVLALIVVSLIPLGIANCVGNVDVLLLYGVVGGLTIWIYVYEPTLLCKYFARILSCIWTIVDVYALENSVIYLPNLREYSFRTGSFYPLVIGFVAFICALIYFDKRHSARIYEEDRITPRGSGAYSPKDRLLSIIVFGLFALMFIAIFDAFMNGYFASGASSRYSYAQQASASVSFFYNLFRILLPIVAIFSYRVSSPKYLYGFTGLYLLFLILIGNKFGALLNAINIAFIAFVFPFANSDAGVRRVTRKALVALLCACAVFLSYSVLQSFLEKGSLESAIGHIVDRVITGQGDVWWGVYAQCSSDAPHIAEIGDEFQAFSASNYNQIDYHFAIYKMMGLIVPDSVLQAYSKTSSRLTSSTEATAFYYLGVFGVVMVEVFIAWLVSLVTNKLIYSCRVGSLVDVCCYGLLYNYALRAASMSELYLFLTPMSLACFAVLFASYVLRKWRRGRCGGAW